MRKGKATLAGLAVGVFALLPVVVRGEYALNLLIMFFLYVIIAQSWNLLGGFTGQVSLGHSAFLGTGALITRLLWTTEFPIWLSVAAGGCASAAMAAAFGIPCLRMRSAYFPIGTLALAMIAQITVANLFPIPGSLSSEYLVSYTIWPRYYLALGLAVLTVLVVSLIVGSRTGLALVAIRDDETAAEAMGVRIFRYKVLALMISALLVGLGGGIFAYHQVSYYHYAPFELTWSFLPTLTTFIGGLGTIGGPILGAACFLGLSELFAISLGQMHIVVFALTFILVVLFFPGGLMSINTKIRSLAATLTKRALGQAGKGGTSA
jgi:branched-chain amino acid transport system permease protein